VVLHQENPREEFGGGDKLLTAQARFTLFFVLNVS
jgi:hypothetical protein